MNKSKHLIDDFNQISEASENEVFELLKQKKHATSRVPESNQRTAVSKSLVEQSLPLGPAGQSRRPTATLNTRIPQELSDRIDDFVYRTKKQCNPTTKQAVTIAALELYLKSLV